MVSYWDGIHRHATRQHPRIPVRTTALIEDRIISIRLNDECRLDLTMKGARLCPVAFGSRSNKTFEEHYHSFVGEISCGGWSIAQNKRYLCGKHFYWICDCNSIKEIIEYTGSIHQLRRWSQENFSYDFNIIHRLAKMMKDVDACSRHLNTLVY